MLEAQHWERRVRERGSRSPMTPAQRAAELKKLDAKLSKD